MDCAKCGKEVTHTKRGKTAFAEACEDDEFVEFFNRKYILQQGKELCAECTKEAQWDYIFDDE